MVPVDTTLARRVTLDQLTQLIHKKNYMLESALLTAVQTHDDRAIAFLETAGLRGAVDFYRRFDRMFPVETLV